MMYAEKQFNLPELTGLSPKQLEVHLKLYAGYVKNVNALTTKIEELKADSATNALALSELTRRYAFEWNGMRLHELYFEVLGGNGTLPTSGPLIEAFTARWGSADTWLAEFKAMAAMRGIGWVLLVQDETTKTVQNIWVADHEVGHLAGCTVLLALDLWEHAFMIDYLPATKADYVTAYLKNLNWQTIEARLKV